MALGKKDSLVSETTTVYMPSSDESLVYGFLDSSTGGLRFSTHCFENPSTHTHIFNDLSLTCVIVLHCVALLHICKIYFSVKFCCKIGDVASLIPSLHAQLLSTCVVKKVCYFLVHVHLKNSWEWRLGMRLAYTDSTCTVYMNSTMCTL